MVERITLNSIMELGRSIFPKKLEFLSSLENLGAFHSRIADLSFTKDGHNSAMISAELHNSISHGKSLNQDQMQNQLASAVDTCYQRFAIIFYVNSLTLLLTGIQQKLTDSCAYHEDDDGNGTANTADTSAVQGILEEIGNTELPYVFGADPAPFVEDFYAEVAEKFQLLLGKKNLRWGDRRSGHSNVSKAASAEFNAWMNAGQRAAKHVRDYLNFDPQVAQQGRVLEGELLN